MVPSARHPLSRRPIICPPNATSRSPSVFIRIGRIFRQAAERFLYARRGRPGYPFWNEPPERFSSASVGKPVGSAWKYRSVRRQKMADKPSSRSLEDLFDQPRPGINQAGVELHQRRARIQARLGIRRIHHPTAGDHRQAAIQPTHHFPRKFLAQRRQRRAGKPACLTCEREVSLSRERSYWRRSSIHPARTRHERGIYEQG